MLRDGHLGALQVRTPMFFSAPPSRSRANASLGHHRSGIFFEGSRIGTAPEGWTPTLTGKGDPKWTVESDGTVPSTSNVLKQSGRATFPLLLKNDSNIKDGFVEVKFKAVAGSQDRAAGIVWRAKDANNYYVVRANALEDNFVLYKTVDGVRTAVRTENPILACRAKMVWPVRPIPKNGQLHGPLRPFLLEREPREWPYCRFGSAQVNFKMRRCKNALRHYASDSGF